METNYETLKDYDIEDQIGSGGFGIVYRIKRKADGKRYALKVVDLESLEDEVKKNSDDYQDAVRKSNRYKAMAKREGEFMEKAQPHENIVKVFCWFMGTLKNAILAQKIKNVNFSARQIIKWGAQLAETLKHLHNKGILHRDVKSENIFITADNNLKLGDFGISKSLDNSTTIRAVTIGSITHAAPEMVDKKVLNPIYDEKAEVWAFGVLMYEITELKLPFTSRNNIFALGEAICNGPMPSITVTISQALRLLILTKLLDRNSTTRPSMDQVIGHLRLMSVPKQKWFEAAMNGEIERVKHYIESGANLNRKDKFNADWTALHYCGDKGYFEMAELLLKNGANVDERDNFGWTPLMGACWRGHQEVAKVFVLYSANVNAKNNYGSTPLMRAVWTGQEDIVRWLVNENRQLNINEKDEWNATALKIANDGKQFWNGNRGKEAAFDRIITFLRSNGAQISVSSRSGTDGV